VSGAGALVLTSLTAVDVATAAPQAGAISWGRCQDPDLRAAGAKCGFLDVPLDWRKPTGTTISIAVSRIRATKGPRQGVLITNPGGPGATGLALPAYLLPEVPNGAGKTYDWIGFDPRGVGDSRPALSCRPDYWNAPRPAYEPAMEAARSPNERRWIARSKKYAAACADNGDLLRHVRTVDTIRDLEALRIALGVKRISFYGFSYGTYLGQLYASRYPDRVRRMVLDGNVPPSYPGYGDGGRAQAAAFELVMDEFFAWVARHSSVYGLGLRRTDVQAAYYDELAKLTAQPVRGIGAAEWTNVIQLAGFAEYLWPAVADAFADWRSGKRGSVRELYDFAGEPGDDNSYAAFLGTVCTDAPFPRHYAQIRQDAFATAEHAPFEAWTNLWFAAPCTFWPTAPGRAPRIDGSRLNVPILLIHATGDGVAPYAGALALRREFPTSVLIAELDATTHAGSLYGNACIDGAIAAYLADGTLPARRPEDGPDATCARIAVPEPSAKDRSVAADPVGTPPATPPSGPQPSGLDALLSRVLPGLPGHRFPGTMTGSPVR
jgi:pimeloyl-ACP methyl ester carboxylesterase